MADTPTQLVIRRRKPVRTALLFTCALLFGAIAVYGVYELGRFDAGYDRQAVSQQRTEYELKLQKLEQVNQGLRTRLAELETTRTGAAQERTELARTIGELQAQVTRQAEKLAFFSNLVTAGEPVGVRIQELRITPGAVPGRFRLELTLVQTARPDKDVSGVVALRIEGKLGGQTNNLDVNPLTVGQPKEQKFSFRYFQKLEDEIDLPANYRPERLVAEITSSMKAVAPTTQSFPWRIDAS